MPAPETVPTRTYAGTFRHTIDSKNRVTVPAAWRSGEEDQFFAIIIPGKEYITLYPPAVFEQKGKALKAETRIPERDKRIFIRKFFSGAQQISTDRQGRIVLPAEFTEKLKLNTEAYLLGTDDRIEIWPVDRYEVVQEDEEQTYERVANILGD